MSSTIYFKNLQKFLKLLPVSKDSFVGQKNKRKQRTLIFLLTIRGGENYFNWIGNDVTGVYYIDPKTRYIKCISKNDFKQITELKLNIIHEL